MTTIKPEKIRNLINAVKNYIDTSSELQLLAQDENDLTKIKFVYAKSLAFADMKKALSEVEE